MCYVNNMSISFRPICKLLQYAEDSTINFLTKIQKLSFNELESCSNWLVDNNLSLNLGKTECIIFGTLRKLKIIANFQIQCNYHIIKSQTKLKYLGLDID
jgi:hypothetical protein